MSQPLQESELMKDPIEQFRDWFAAAEAVIHDRPEAMTLATATPDGVVSARVVLLKDFDSDGFVFFTNYDSDKGRQLEANPNAALVFWWPPLDRQVRIEGAVEKVSAEESDAYFATRPHGSRIGAWASPQSRRLTNRDELETEARLVGERYPDVVPRPANWGGYRVVPTALEFWQGQPDRLHDRFRFEKSETGWSVSRLAP